MLKARNYIKSDFICIYALLLVLVLPNILQGEDWDSFLNSSTINDMLSQENAIYAATNGGLLILDQKDTAFTKLTNVQGLLSNNIKAVATDNFGNIWCLCIGGGITLMQSSLNGWDYRNFTNWHGIQTYDFLSILIDSNVVWVGIEDKMLTFDTGGDNPFEVVDVNFVSLNILPSNKVNVMKAIGDSLWFGTDKGVGVIDREADFSDSSHWVVYDKKSGLPSNKIQAIEFWSEMVWIGTDSGVARQKGGDWEKVVEGLPDYRIYDFASNDTALWVGTYYGIAQWNDDKWVQVQGSSAYKVNSMLIDSLLWFSAMGDRIGKYDGNTVHLYTPNESASNTFSGMALGLDGSLWCTHYRATKAISRYCSDGTWKIYNRENEWGIGGDGPTEVVTDMEGNTYIGAWDYTNQLGLIKITSEDSVDTLRIPSSEVVSALHIDKDGHLWVGTWPTLLYEFEDDLILNTYSEVEHATAITSDDSGNVWVGGGNGLWKFNKKSLEWKPITDLPSITALSSDIEGNIWVGTMYGMYKIKNEAVIANYDVIVCDITSDPKGNLWFTTLHEGVTKLDSQGQFKEYTVKDGLVSSRMDRENDHTGRILFDTKTGYLWIGTTYGLSRFQTGMGPSADILLIDVYPNPFVPDKGQEFITFFPQEHTEVSIKIYSIEGKLIKQIEEAPIVDWDAKDTNGKNLGTGIYIFVATSKDGRKKIGKLSIIR